MRATSHRGNHCVAWKMEDEIKLFMCAELILRRIHYKTPSSKVLLGKIIFKDR
jgi:hypothetical protein